MNIHELSTYNLADAVKFHRRLNPRIWGRDEHLLPEVREKLLAIAEDFQEFLGVEDLNVQDITISGSNAAYSYTKNSDIDLHLIVQMPDNPVYQELFTAKKYQYNDEHNIKIGGADVELYVQPADQAHHSQGIYSIRENKWVSVPQRKRAQVDDACVRDKVASLDARIHSAVQSKNLESVTRLWDKIKAMRKIGLEQHGEFGCENIAFKILRNSGCIKLLKDTKTELEDQELSLREADKPRQRFRYGFSEGMQSQPYSTSDGVAASTKQFLEDSDSDSSIVQDFIQHVTSELGIDPMPEIVLHTNPEWSENNHSFGRYDPESHTLNVSMPNRHVLDVLRTVAHELVHCSQNQQHGQLPDDAGETGSRWENDANARAGIIMRDWANTHPEHFAHEPLEENASGYIPKNKREAAMPQYAMALSVDIRPGEVGRQANKLGLKTGRNGEPGLLQPDAQNLLREFAEFVTEQENLFEISMSPTSLKKLSAQTGALAGMEFEMIVPGVRDEDQDREPDYDYDERTRSIDEICDFFNDGDFNSRRQIDDLRRRLTISYEEWAEDQIQEEWDNQGLALMYQYVKNNVDDETIIAALGLEPDEAGNPPAISRAEYSQYAELCMEEQNDTYDEALQEFRDEWFNDYNHEDDWLQSEGLDYMSNVEQEYGGLVTWPHWNDPDAGQTDVEQVADNFSAAIGRKVNWSRNYHGGKREPNAYVVEPDSSLDPDDPNDSGLEFVSPPLPIEELLSDLNTVKAWANKNGCYTNDSTGLHINVSVPGWSGDYNQLDYVKLAVLLGDEYVLDSFGRAGNTYAKSAIGKIRTKIKQNPAKAEELLTMMKSGMNQLASKAIHSGVTEKYTSINTKTGYIEFRSPGGDWLDTNFDQIENTLRRFTVALSAAVDPEAYRKEYLKKLYKLLDVSSEKDPLSYFAKYAAGELPRAALKSFVRQARLEREVKRGKETGPMWWRVYKEGKNARNGAIIEVVASSEKEAKEKAAKEWGLFSDEYKLVMDAEPLRPYTEKTKGPELNGRPSNPDGNYVIVNGATNEPAYRYMATDGGDALTVLRQWITANPGTQWNFKLDPDQSLGQPDQIAPPRGWASATQQAQPEFGLWDFTQGGFIDSRREVGQGGRLLGGDSVDAAQEVARRSGLATSLNIGEIQVRRIPRDEPEQSAQPTNQGGGRPNDPTGRYAIVARNDTAAYGRRGGPAPYYYFRFNMQLTVANRLQGLYVLQAWAARNNVNAADYMVVDTTEYADSGTAQDLPNLFPDIPAANPTGEFNGQWKVVDGLGREVYRFGGVGNSQADANRVAATWARTTGFDGNIEVYPVMAESLREYRMPQPSHGPGAIKDLNEPLGPETPPTMPAGTVKVDVSDVYDWYKLGQHISNMKGLGQHDFGKGPPSAILSFGDEDLEHEYIQALKRTGLTTTDIDPVDPNQPQGMPRQKTDPTYNVAEGSEQDYLSQIPGLSWQPVSRSVWNTIQDEGLDEEQEAPNHTDWVMASLSISPKDTHALQAFDDDAIEDFNRFDIHLKSRYPGLTDLIDYDKGTVTIVKPINTQDVDENFADGKNPGRKGLSKRVGVNTKASVSDLRRTAKNSSGEKQRMAHWLANMKAGRAKAKKK